MRLLTIILTTLLISCSGTDKKKNLFSGFEDKETVFIYLSKYKLDSLPKEIETLKAVKSLYVTKDSGWIIYPPLSALREMTDIPPFRKLPNEITELTKLEALALIGLNLKTLPDNFGNLENLDSLDLSMNKLKISNEITKLKKLKNLKYLGLFGNKVDSVDIKELKKERPNLVVESGVE